MRILKGLLLVLVLILVVAVGAGLWLFSQAEDLAADAIRDALRADRVAIGEIRIEPSLAVAVRDVELAMPGLTLSVGRIDVAPLRLGHLRGATSAEIEISGVRFELEPGALTPADDSAAAAPAAWPAFAMPIVALADAIGTVRVEGRTLPVEIPAFRIAPADGAQALDFQGIARLPKVIEANLSGRVGQNGFSLRIPRSEFDVAALAGAGGLDLITEGRGLIDLNYSQTGDATSIEGLFEAQGVGLALGETVLKVRAFRLAFSTSDPLRGADVDGAVLVHGYPRLNIKGRFKPEAMDLRLAMPRIRAERLAVPPEMPGQLVGEAAWQGTLSGPIGAPRLVWELTPKDLAYQNEELFRAAIPIGPARGDIRLVDTVVKSADVSGSIAGLGYRVNLAADQRTVLRLQNDGIIAVADLRGLVPLPLLDKDLGKEVMRQLRQGEIDELVVELLCAKPDVAECGADWQIAVIGAKASGLRLAAFPRSPSIYVDRVEIANIDQDVVIVIGGENEKAPNRISKGRIVAKNALGGSLGKVEGEVVGSLRLADLARDLRGRVPALDAADLKVRTGAAEGAARFVWHPENGLEALSADLNIRGAAGSIADAGPFRNATLKAAVTMQPDGALPLEIETIGADGTSWKIWGGGRVVLRDTTAKPDLKLQIEVVPELVRQIIGETGDFAWTGGPLKADVKVVGSSDDLIEAIGAFDASAACLALDTFIILACEESLIARGRLGYRPASAALSITLDQLALAEQSLVRKATAQRDADGWALSMIGEEVPWGWLAARMGLSLPAQPKGRVRLDANLVGEKMSALLTVRDASLPADIGISGDLTGSVGVQPDELQIDGTVNLLTPRKARAQVVGSVRNYLAGDPSTRLNVVVPEIDGRAQFGNATANGAAAKPDGVAGNVVKEINAMLGEMPEPSIPGRGDVELTFQKMRVGPNDDDWVSGTGKMTWGALNRYFEVEVRRLGEPAGVLRFISRRSDPIEPLQVEIGFAARNLPMPLIGSWIGRPRLFAKGTGDAQAILRWRWGRPLSNLKGSFDITASEITIGFSEFGKSVFEQAGAGDAAQSLGGGDGLQVDNFRFAGRFRQGRLAISSLYLDTALVDAFAVGSAGLDEGDLQCKIVIRPLRSVGRAVGAIPLIGYVLTGDDKTLLDLSFDLTGNLAKPEVSKTPKLDTERGLFGAMRRFDRLPSLLFQIPADDDDD